MEAIRQGRVNMMLHNKLKEKFWRATDGTKNKMSRLFNEELNYKVCHYCSERSTSC